MKKPKVAKVKREPRSKKEWREYVEWRMSDAARKDRELPEPPVCPSCGQDWRTLPDELALPPEAICPPCARKRRK